MKSLQELANIYWHLSSKRDQLAGAVDAAFAAACTAKTEAKTT